VPRKLVIAGATMVLSGLLLLPASGQNWDGIPRRADGTRIEAETGPHSEGIISRFPLTPNERIAQNVRQVPWRTPSDDTGSAPGVVSMHELQHPLSEKDKHRLEAAAKDLREGRAEDGMRKLQATLEDPSTAGYAHGLLGTAYLRQGDLRLAVENLTQAVSMLPGSAAMHSNLGYALCLSGSLRDGEQEIRKALALDPDLPATQYLLGLILLNRSAPPREVVEHFLLAQNSIRNAHLALAIMYAREDKPELVDEQVRLFRPEESSRAPLKEWISSVAVLPQPGAMLGLSIDPAR